MALVKPRLAEPEMDVTKRGHTYTVKVGPYTTTIELLNKKGVLDTYVADVSSGKKNIASLHGHTLVDGEIAAFDHLLADEKAFTSRERAAAICALLGSVEEVFRREGVENIRCNTHGHLARIHKDMGYNITPRGEGASTFFDVSRDIQGKKVRWPKKFLEFLAAQNVKI